MSGDFHTARNFGAAVTTTLARTIESPTHKERMFISFDSNASTRRRPSLLFALPSVPIWISGNAAPIRHPGAASTYSAFDMFGASTHRTDLGPCSRFVGVENRVFR